MKAHLSHLPLSVSAIGLSFLGLAGLVPGLPFFSNLFAMVGTLILMSVLLNIALNWPQFRLQMKEVPVAATFPTFSMGVMLVAKNCVPYSMVIAKWLWFAGIGLHLLLMGYFTFTFVSKRELKLVLPSWFIVYVGSVMATMTAPLFDQLVLGKIIFWFGLIMFIVLLPLVLWRLRQFPLPLALRPTIAILAAPAALNLAGYLSVYPNQRPWLIILQLLLSQLLYFYVLRQIPSLLAMPFSPSQGALTFPLVITTTALKLGGAALSLLLGRAFPFLKWLMIIELVIACTVTIMVLINYWKYLFHQKKSV